MIRLVLVGLLSTLLYAAEGVIKLGFMPYLSAEVLTEKYSPLASYLTQELGTKVEIFISSSYAEHIEKTARDELCIAFLGGSPYVEIVDRYGSKPLLARFEFDGEAAFRSVVFVAEESPLKTLADLKGKRFAFGSPQSTLSAQVPLHMLLQAGIKLSDLKQYRFLDNHENVYLGVYYDDFDAGAVAEELFTPQAMPGVRALAYSQPYSTHVFVARANMEPHQIEAIRRALLALKDNPRHAHVLKAISQNLSGFVPAQDSDYDRHRAMLKAVKPVLKQP
ncbi:MAG: phosphate/phosphite/phosphonate ABC transporter substrate-binding protein [Campylobacterales bacterium]